MSHITVHTQPSPTERSATISRRLIVLLVALAVLTAVSIATWARLAGSSPSPAALAWTVVAGDRPSLLPGGSVYDSQVPATADNAGGGVYDSQVPAAARAASSS
jgi:hypothetical protein